MEVGRISARLDAIFDDRGFDRFERALKGVRADARRGADAVLKADDSDFRTAIRRFSSEMKQARAERDVEVDVKADVDTQSFSRAERSLNEVDRKADRAEKSSKRMGGALKGAALAGGVTAAFYGIGRAIGFVSDNAGEAEKVQAQTEARLKSTGGAANVTAKQVGDLATEISNYSGMDDEAVQSGENLLLTFTKIRNEAGKGNDVFNQATKISADLSVALGKDLNGSAMMVGKALNDPIKGVTALGRAGVQFTEQQKAQIKALVESGDTMGAQKVILRELETQVGGSAKAMGDTLPGALGKMKTALGNVAEMAGGFVAPAIGKAADFVTKLVNGFSDGDKASGRFRGAMNTVRTAMNSVRTVASRVWNFVKQVIDDNRGSFERIAKTARTAFNGIRKFVGDLGDRFRKVFGGSGIGADIRGAIRVILDFVSRVQQVLVGTIVKRVLPALSGAFEGVLTVIRGVVRIISGILRGDFSKAWDGAKDVVRGAVKAIGSIAKGLGGILLDAGKAAGRALLSGLKSVFTAAGGFAADIGRSIANWINANTPFGDKIKVGPVSVRLPALARGGKVGPGFGGMRAFIAGEGELPEWVISQQGDRGQNVQWAKEALEALTGKRVELHKSGKGKPKKKKVNHKTVRDVLGTTGKRSISRGEQGMKNFEDKIQRMEREYDQLDRAFGQSEEILLIENDDGSVTVDEPARQKRNKELEDLKKKRESIRGEINKYKAAVKKAIAAYRKAIRKLEAAIKAAKGDVHAKDRQKYADEIATYRDRISELRGVGQSLGLDVIDQNLDLSELQAEIDSNNAMKSEAAPVDSGTSDTGGGSTDTAAPPSPLEIAEAAAQQFAAFTSQRADLFGAFGSNFVAAKGGAAFGDETQQAAGARFFGAASGNEQSNVTNKTINVTNNYASGPEDTLTYSRGLEFELGAIG